jgi:hypothetical protein
VVEKQRKIIKYTPKQILLHIESNGYIVFVFIESMEGSGRSGAFMKDGVSMGYGGGRTVASG